MDFKLRTRTDIAQAIADGENSYVEFKEQLTEARSFAKEMVAFANARGGAIFIGVDDDGVVVGVTPDDATAGVNAYGGLEERIMQIARDKIRPPLVPGFRIARGFDGEKDIAIVDVGRGLDVHAVWHDQRLSYVIRVGSTSREASPEELQRLFQRRGFYRAELTPLVAATLDSFDHRRLEEYFRLRGQHYPTDDAERERILLLAEFMGLDEIGEARPTLAGLSLFGMSPERVVPGCAIDAVAFNGLEANTDVREQLTIRGPMVALRNPTAFGGEGTIEFAVQFIERNMKRFGDVEGLRRDTHEPLPTAVLREAVLNAVAHRDYSLSSRAVSVRVFADRVEIASPGALPNGITVENMLIGTRASRNQLLVDTLRDYGYLERLALGVPTMVRLMREYNGTMPRFDERQETLSVTLYL